MESYQSIAIVLGIIGIFLGLLSSIAIGSYAVVVILVSIVGIVVPLVNTKHHNKVGVVLIVLRILGNLLLIIPGIMACRYKPESNSEIKPSNKEEGASG